MKPQPCCACLPMPFLLSRRGTTETDKSECCISGLNGGCLSYIRLYYHSLLPYFKVLLHRIYPDNTFALGCYIFIGFLIEALNCMPAVIAISLALSLRMIKTLIAGLLSSTPPVSSPFPLQLMVLPVP